MINRGSPDESVFSFATDERTMASHLRKRGEPANPALLAKMKKFVRKFYLNQGKEVPLVRSELAGMAPVLRPKRDMKYHFNA